MCKSPKNPLVIAAQGAPVPCTPICKPWIGGKADVLVQGAPGLLTNAKTICMLGMGVIKIKSSGQGGADNSNPDGADEKHVNPSAERKTLTVLDNPENASDDKSDDVKNELALEEPFFSGLVNMANKLFGKSEESNDIVTIWPTLEVIKEMYPSLNDKQARVMLRSHLAVLEHGLKNDTEKVHIRNSKTGKIVFEEDGYKDSKGKNTVSLSEFEKQNKGKEDSMTVLSTHNHPHNKAFSSLDMGSFSDIENMECIGIQGHNGNIFTLTKTTDSRKEPLTEGEIFRAYCEVVHNVESDEISAVEVSIMHTEKIADLMGWVFRKKVYS